MREWLQKWLTREGEPRQTGVDLMPGESANFAVALSPALAASISEARERGEELRFIKHRPRRRGRGKYEMEVDLSINGMLCATFSIKYEQEEP